MAVMAAPSRRRLSDVSIRCPNCETCDGVSGVRDLTTDLISRMDELRILFDHEVGRRLYCVEHAHPMPKICPVCAVAAATNPPEVRSMP